MSRIRFLPSIRARSRTRLARCWASAWTWPACVNGERPSVSGMSPAPAIWSRTAPTLAWSYRDRSTRDRSRAAPLSAPGRPPAMTALRSHGTPAAASYMPATSRACCRPRSPVQITVTALGSRGQAASSGPAVTPDMVTRPVGVTQVVLTQSVQGRRVLIAQRPANRNRYETRIQRVRTHWNPGFTPSCFALPGDLEERGAQDEPRGKDHDQPGDDDADERPALAPRRLTQRLDEDPAQEAGRAEREQAAGPDGDGPLDVAPAVVSDACERGEYIEDREQQAGHVDHVDESVLHRGDQVVDRAQDDDEQADDDAGGDRGGVPAGHGAEELRQHPVAGHAVDDSRAERDPRTGGWRGR